MPVEIKELLIEIKVSDQVKSLEQSSGDEKSRLKYEVLNLCIEEVSKMLNSKKER